MASVHKKGATSWGVSYTYKDDAGQTKQKEETFQDELAAKKRAAEIEYLKEKGTFVAPVEKTLEKFLVEFVEIYGTTKWSCSSYSTNTGMIKNYVNPHIGKVKLKHLNPKRMDEYFNSLKTMPKVPMTGRSDVGLVTNRVIKEIHVLLNTAMNKAVEWGEIGKNPITRSSKPVVKKKIKRVLEPSQTKYLISQCEDLRLLACIYLALGCSMRIGEVLGLRWENVSFGNVEKDYEDAKLQIVEEFQRVTLEALSKLKNRLEDIHFIFPTIKREAKTRLVLKTPKTESSVRTVWIPETVCRLLLNIRKEQDRHKRALGKEYEDYDLVIARTNGRPLEESRVKELMDELIAKTKLPHVTFHSLRHTSTTIKLLITQGDIKSVQGDNGHAEARMVTDTYSMIVDKNRKKTAQLFDKEFFEQEDGEGGQPNEDPSQIKKLAEMFSADPDLLLKVYAEIKNKSQA